MKDLVCIRTFTSHGEATVAQGLLRSCGIESLIRADDAGGADPLLVIVGPGMIRLMVKHADAEEAVGILNGS